MKKCYHVLILVLFQKINSSAIGVKYVVKNLKVNWNLKLKVLKIVLGS